MLHQRLFDPSLSDTERAFLDALAPVFTDLEESVQASLYVGGTARLLEVGRVSNLDELNQLMDMLERRVALLAMLRSALSPSHDVAVRIGAENEIPALRSLVLVAANYGLPQRSLGSVSLIGPLRMDYGGAINAVREAAAQLSTFVADVYDDEIDERDPRLLRGPRGRARRRRRRDQEGVSQARARVASRRQQPRPAGRGEVQGGRGGIRGAVGLRATRDL